MDNNDTGLLLNKSNITLQRTYFKELVRLKGLNVLFRSPLEGSKAYNGYGELDAFYNSPVVVGCIYDEHPTQRTMKKLGWDAELADTSTVIHVPYDLQGCQVGALFVIPSGLDNAEGRVFRVVKMSNIAIYPATISCELAPVWKNSSQPSEVTDFSQSNFNVLYDPEDVED